MTFPRPCDSVLVVDTLEVMIADPGTVNDTTVAAIGALLRASPGDGEVIIHLPHRRLRAAPRVHVTADLASRVAGTVRGWSAVALSDARPQRTTPTPPPPPRRLPPVADRGRGRGSPPPPRRARVDDAAIVARVQAVFPGATVVE